MTNVKQDKPNLTLDGNVKQETVSHSEQNSAFVQDERQNELKHIALEALNQWRGWVRSELEGTKFYEGDVAEIDRYIERVNAICNRETAPLEDWIKKFEHWIQVCTDPEDSGKWTLRNSENVISALCNMLYFVEAYRSGDLGIKVIAEPLNSDQRKDSGK